MKNLLILGGTAFAVYWLLNRQAVAGQVTESGGRLAVTTTGKVVELTTGKDEFIYDQYGGRWV